MAGEGDLHAVDAVTGFHHVSLTVGDLDRSGRWYEDVFDLDVLFEEPGEDRRARVYRIAGTATMLGLVQHRSTEEQTFRSDRIGLDHLAFSVASRADVERWAAHLSALGIAHSGVIDVPTGSILNFRDPDDIQLSVFAEGVER